MIKHWVGLQMPAGPMGIVQAQAPCWPALGRTHVEQHQRGAPPTTTTTTTTTVTIIITVTIIATAIATATNYCNYHYYYYD